jgi:hypothetical protein
MEKPTRARAAEDSIVGRNVKGKEWSRSLISAFT